MLFINVIRAAKSIPGITIFCTIRLSKEVDAYNTGTAADIFAALPSAVIISIYSGCKVFDVSAILSTAFEAVPEAYENDCIIVIINTAEHIY